VPASYCKEEVEVGNFLPLSGDPGAAPTVEYVSPPYMRENRLLPWPAAPQELTGLVVATVSGDVRWHGSTRVALPAAVWPTSHRKEHFQLGRLVTGKELPYGWSLWLAYATAPDGEVLGWACPCGLRFISRWLRDPDA
jgi:hypothetical protein